MSVVNTIIIILKMDFLFIIILIEQYNINELSILPVKIITIIDLSIFPLSASQVNSAINTYL